MAPVKVTLGELALTHVAVLPLIEAVGKAGAALIVAIADAAEVHPPMDIEKV